MKKLLPLLAFVLSVCCTSFAHAPVSNEKVEYCELTTGTKAFKTKSTVYINYGTGNEKLVDDQGKEMLFSSSVGVLNYMHSKGWEVVDTYRENGFTYYLLRRKG